MKKPKIPILATLSFLALGGVQATSADSSGSRAKFDSALRNAGWEVVRPPDGSLILRPPAAAAAPAPSRETGKGEQAIWDRLRASGWRVERESDGSVLLFPPESRADVITPTAPVSPPAASVKATQQPSLEDLLEHRNWRVERSADGSLLLYPRQPEGKEEPQRHRDPKPAEGVVLAPIDEKKVVLPVDRWKEARKLAEAWVGVFGGAELTVGKIRKVQRVYVVSIVEAQPPFRLRHQLAINTADGRVILLN